MARVLHITPHMGGGVGKVLSGLVAAAAKTSPHRHDILCLEAPEKDLFVQRAKAAGGQVTVEPDLAKLPGYLSEADIVQVEFWNHPTIARALSALPWPAVRPVFWSHISGLHAPVFPEALFDQAYHWALTSGCSFESATVQSWRAQRPDDISVISSAGDLEILPQPKEKSTDGPMSLGYIGTLNFSKLHPDLVAFLKTMPTDLQPLHLYGDVLNRDVLMAECRAVGCPNLLSFAGFQSDIAGVLQTLDVLVYLLNPYHYGTAENALVEAMAAGVVPVVLGNACERHIVSHGETGFIVQNTADLGRVLDQLKGDRGLLRSIARQAASVARESYSYEVTSQAFDRVYDRVLTEPKVIPDFRAAMGHNPADWFLAFQSPNGPFQPAGGVDMPTDLTRYGLVEKTKGSVFHFLKNNPDDERLKAWAKAIEQAPLDLQG